MSVPLFLDSVLIIGFTFLIFSPFDRKRTRALWAKLMFAASGVIGLAYSITDLMLDMHWMVLSRSSNYKLQDMRHSIAGLLVGVLLSLVFSGQARGAKREGTNCAST